MEEKREYEKPEVTGEQEFETRAVGCAKVPGLGDPNFCGTNFAGLTGWGRGCTRTDPSVARSS